MEEKYLHIAKKFKELVSKKVNVHELKVYRSGAIEDTDGSFLDLFIVVDKLNRTIDEYIMDCAFEVGFNEDAIITTNPISKNELENGIKHRSGLIENVYRKGVSV